MVGGAFAERQFTWLRSSTWLIVPCHRVKVLLIRTCAGPSLSAGSGVRNRRAAFAACRLMADNVEAFTCLSQQDALKELQELSGIGCKSVEYKRLNFRT